MRRLGTFSDADGISQLLLRLTDALLPPALRRCLLEAGSASVSKAFRRYFGVSPGVYRRSGSLPREDA